METPTTFDTGYLAHITQVSPVDVQKMARHIFRIGRNFACGLIMLWKIHCLNFVHFGRLVFKIQQNENSFFSFCRRPFLPLVFSFYFFLYPFFLLSNNLRHMAIYSFLWAIFLLYSFFFNFKFNGTNLSLKFWYPPLLKNQYLPRLLKF